MLGLAGGGASACLWPLLRLPYLAALALYGGLTFLSTAHPNPLLWLTTWAGVVATHLVYGVRFLAGLLARRMPCEVAAFDHPADPTGDPP